MKKEEQMDYKELFSMIDKNEDYIIELLRKIIAVDTTVPPGKNYDKFIDIVEPEFRKFGFTTKRVVMPQDKVNQMPWDLIGDRTNLVARLDNPKPKVTAYAHMDVVPIEESWTHDPFGGEIVEGKLFGRGAVDMKGSIACFLGAVKALYTMGIEPGYSVGCCLCTDEEMGLYPGARYLAEQGYFSPHLMWLEIGSQEPVIYTGLAGTVRMDVKAIGKSCHSGMNYLGINAIEQLIPVLNELILLKKEAEQRLSKIPTFPIPGCPYQRMTPMFNFNLLHGGKKENIVPSECVLTINRRYIPDERYEDVVAEVEEAIKRGKQKSRLIDVQLSVVHCYPPVEINPESLAVKKKIAATRAVKGTKEFLYGGLSVSSDLGFVAEALKPQKIDVACFGPGSRGADISAHGADEFVYIEDLVSMTKELAYYLAY
jgi:succinyl-diaminopimelate desuccinylase